jgi:hypothetical protein
LKHNVPRCHVFVERQRDKVVVGNLPLALHEPEAQNGDQRNPVQSPVGDVPTVVLPGNVHGRDGAPVRVTSRFIVSKK